MQSVATIGLDKADLRIAYKKSQTAFTPRKHLSVHGTGELYQRPIAHHLDDAAMMFGSHRLNNFGTPRFEHSQGARFVTLHQAAEADYIDS